MDFFKSILSDDPDPNSQDSSKDVLVDPDPNSAKPNSTTTAADDGGDGGGVWSFGGLLKTLSTRSESVLETYRRDLQEFGSGLKKETELFREVASRAVKELPNSLEVGTTVSHAIDAVKDTLLASSDVEPEPETETPDANRSLNSGRYSRFESQLMSLQSDPNTFCVDPEDLEEYKKWKSEFDLKEKSEEIDYLNGENGSLEGMYKSVVPNEVDDETFWCRYFYKVFKLKQKESVRANLVRRAISLDDEEELSWDVDDDDNEHESNAKSKVDENGKEEGEESTVNDAKNSASDETEFANQDSTKLAKEVPIDKSDPNKQDLTNVAKEVPSDKSEPSKQDSSNIVEQATHSDESQTLSSAAVDRKEENQSNEDGGGIESSGNSKDSKKENTEVTSLVKNVEGVVKGSEGKSDRDESGKHGDVPVASSKKTGNEEDDLDWDEIEDFEDNDDKKATSSHVASSSNRADLRKRLSVEEDDEDLSWD